MAIIVEYDALSQENHEEAVTSNRASRKAQLSSLNMTTILFFFPRPKKIRKKHPAVRLANVSQESSLSL